MDGYIGRDLREKLDNHIIFQRQGAAAEKGTGLCGFGKPGFGPCQTCSPAQSDAVEGLVKALRRDLDQARQIIVDDLPVDPSLNLHLTGGAARDILNDLDRALSRLAAYEKQKEKADAD